MRLPSLSIRSTVLLAIAAGMVLPALVVLAVDRQVARATQEPVVQSSRAAVLALATAVITEPAWTLSESGLRSAIERILREPSVCGLEIVGLKSAPSSLPLQQHKCRTDHAVVVLSAPVLYAGERIAQLQLDFDDTEIDQRLDDRLRATAWLVATQVLLGMVVLAAVLSLRLLRPIGRLKQQAGTLTARGPSTPTPWTRGDELGQLGQHLNEVREHIQQLFSELEAKNAQLHRMAMHDPLTGLPNRTLLRELFEHEAAAARRSNEMLALLFIDLDHFKTVNDTLGHAAGDELLVGVAQRLVQAVRESDIVCRMGGDEFLVLLRQAEGREQITATVTRLLAAIEAPLTLSQAASATEISASIGVAMYPADGGDFNALARTADLAMYRSKDLGRARFSFYQPELDDALRGRLALERELQQAIAGGELVLHYQPVVDARDARVVGCEALLRWNHPQRGLLMPGDFIAQVESGGQVHALGRWTLEAACAQFAAWRAAGTQPPRIAVNLSALQAHDDSLVGVVQAAMRTHGLAAGELEIELAEGSLLSHTDHARRTVQRLREAGALLAIDDFGTGHSSLSYLKLLEPDKLKLDISFVHGLPDDEHDLALTRAVVGIATALSITLVAEGVETPAQSELLLALGCPLQQGFLHGHPLPAAEMTARLAAAALSA